MPFRRSDSGSPRGCAFAPRLLIALVVAGISLVSYWRSREYNPITEEKQAVAISREQEVALGLQAVPDMAAQFGGQDPDPQKQALVDRVGKRILDRSRAGQSGYPFEFTVLADRETINAFALPGGPVFITAALLDRLETEGELAGVLGHEIGHVVARHGAEHIAKAQLTQGLTGAAVLATYDPNDPQSRNRAVIAAVVGQLINMKYGRDDELQSDKLGVRYMSEAGYDPRSMVALMKILSEAGGGGRGLDWTSTHPNPDRRIEKINAAIDELFKDGVPSGLEK
jgi:predicted Zn-dependent protease